MAENTVFNTLNAVNVNDHVEKKNTGKTQLSYLSWTYAWAEVKKRYPDASYEIMRFEKGLPYVYDPNTGYMVFTKVTIQGVTHEMWLPCMDSHNEAMLATPRTVKTKYNEFTVDACTMFDINKTIMRCLVKNLAMFGLGLYIYSGEDMPNGEPVYTEDDLIEQTTILENHLENKVFDGLAHAEELRNNAQKAIDDKDYERICKANQFAKSILEKQGVA
jgi:hypothetical protein